MRIGDVSRHRRFADPARQKWYAYYRTLRFSLRMLCPREGPPSLSFLEGKARQEFFACLGPVAALRRT